MTGKKKLLIAIGSIIFLLYAACIRKTAIEDVTLPVDSAMNNADRYAVVIETYVSLKDSPGSGGISVGHARKKDIYAVLGTEFISHNTHSELWIHLTEGWLQRSCVELYPTKEKAATAAARLK